MKSYLLTRNRKNTITKNLKKNALIVHELVANDIFEKTSKVQRHARQTYSGRCWNQQIIYDTEKSILNYKKIFFLIRFFDFFHLPILFFGSSVLLEFFFKSLSVRTNHFFLLEEDWVPGLLTTEKIFPVLIVCLKKKSIFSGRDLFTKLIPFSCFVEFSDLHSLNHYDYSIWLSLKSKASVKLFLNFFKQLKIKKDGKR